MRAANGHVMELAAVRRKTRHKVDMEQKARLQLDKGIPHNMNMTETLATSANDLGATLKCQGMLMEHPSSILSDSLTRAR